MEQEENVNLDTEIEELEEIDTSEEEVEEEDEKPEYTDREKQLYARLKKEQKERTELEEKLKADKPTVDKEAHSQELNMSQKDMLALIKADVHEDDIDEVAKAAQLLGVSIAEALKDNVLATILENRVAKRTTAEATNTKTSRSGAKKVSDAELLKRSSAGDIPEAGTEEAERLFQLRHSSAKRGA